MNQWYYAHNGTQQGPVSETEFLGLVRAGTIHAGTLIWHVGMADWQTYGRVPDAPRDASLPTAPPPLPPAIQQPPAPQGRGTEPDTERPKIPSHMKAAVLLTLACCFPPTSLVAIVFAAGVNRMLAAGDIAGAMNASRKARLWCWITVVAGILVNGGAILWFLPDLVIVTKSIMDLVHQSSAQDLGM